MPTFTEYQLEYRTWQVLATVSKENPITDGDFDLCKTLFLRADSSTRGTWLDGSCVSEQLAVRLMEQTNKTELNRVGKVLLTWRKNHTGRSDPYNRRSELLLRAAATRCAQGGGNKLFAAQLCKELVHTPLRVELRGTDILDRIVRRALGDKPFNEGVGSLGYEKVTSAVATLYRDLHGMADAEIDRLIVVKPGSSALSAADWSGHIGRRGHDFTPERLLRMFDQYIGRVNVDDIGAVVGDNLDLLVEKADQYTRDDRLSLVRTWYVERNRTFDAPLAMFHSGYTNSRLSWVSDLWAVTRSGPSVAAAAGAMFAQPRLLPLMLTGPRDGSGDAQLVAAGTFAAAQLVGTCQPEPFCESMPTWAYMSAMRILTKITLSKELLSWLTEKTPGLREHHARGDFPANPV